MDNNNGKNNSGADNGNLIDGIKFRPENNGGSNHKPVKNIDIGAINSASSFNTVQVPQTPKKKFVVNFKTEDISSASPKTKQKKSMGVYFTKPVQNTPAAIPISKVGAKKPASSVIQTTSAAKNTAASAEKQAQSKSEKKVKASRAGKRAFLPFLVFVLIISTAISAVGISCINDVLALGREEESVAVTIPNNVDANDIIDILDENNLIHQKTFCKFFFRLKNAVFEKKKGESYIDSFKRDPSKELVFLSGVYYVKSNIGLEGFMNKFQKEQETESTINVFFPEGWTVYQMFDKLESFGVCSKSELVAALTGADYNYEFIKSIEPGQNRVFKLEGYLFPDTYEFYEICDANTIIRKMLSNFESKWSDKYSERAKELGYSMDEIISIASIIQREAANTKQMKQVSSVIHNRLRNSVTYPTLGCDSTLNYIRKFVSPNVSTMQSQLFEDAYNTSAIQGLPAGPICNPGEDAIEAALYPEDTDYYYFCHDKTGKIYLSRTNAEHDANLLEVLRVNNG